MHERTAIATSDALRAASYAVLKACKMASEATIAMRSRVAMPNGTTDNRVTDNGAMSNGAPLNGATLALIADDERKIADRQCAAFRAVLETRRAYLLAISLAAQITELPGTSSKPLHSARRHINRKRHRPHVQDGSIGQPIRARTLHLVADTE